MTAKRSTTRATWEGLPSTSRMPRRSARRLKICRPASAAFGSLSFFVQKFLPGGRELIIGATAERELGHLVMFGLGGIYVEVLKDVAFKIAPVTHLEAREMLAGIKTAALLDGVRGEKGVDKEGDHQPHPTRLPAAYRPADDSGDGHESDHGLQ